MLYRLDIKYTGVYDPNAEDPEITITPIPDKPGTYNYSWVTHYATMNSNEINGTLTEVWNGISTFTFNVYKSSSCWDCFFPARTAVRLYSEKEQRYIFNGRVADVTENMDADGLLYRTVQCENELSYLCDSICDTQEVAERMQQFNRVMCARDVLITMLELHHINAEGIAGTLKKGFMPPNSTWNDTTNAYDYPSTCYPAPSIDEAFNGDVDTTWALIQDILIDKLGMDLWVTYDDSVVPEGGDATWTFGYNVLNMWYGTTKTYGDPITVSTNMQSLKIETAPTSNGRITRIVPLGGIGVNGTRLNVSSIPQYHEGWTDPSYEKAISNEILSITYGHVDKVSLHEDLVDNGNKTEQEIADMIQELYRRGKAEADALSGGITSITLRAVDLYEAGYSGANKFEIGKYHRIVNGFFGLDEDFRLIRKTTDLAEPYNPELEFAKSRTSQTNLTANRQTRTSERIYNVENMLASRLDKSAVKLTTASQYEAMTSRNPTTVHYADQGDGTWKAYMGDEPIVFSEGGGEWSVETAVILNNGNFDNFVITEEEMAEISETTKFYYGATSRFIVLQGHLCYFGNGNTSSAGTLPPKLDGSTENFQAVLDNAEYFSSVSYSGMLSPEHTLMSYPSGNDDTFVRFWSWATTVYSASWNYNSTDGEFAREDLRFFASRWTLDTGVKPTELKFYDDLTAEEKAAVVNNRTWWNMDTYYTGSVYENGTYKLTNFAPSWFVLPIVQHIYDTVTTPNGYPTPYGYATIKSLRLIANDEYTSSNSIPSGALLAGSVNIPYMPFASQAEHDFAFSLTKRSIPQEVTPNA